VREKSNLPKELTLHSLRHTFGTRAGESGMVPAIVLMNLMGQSSLVTTSRYMHASSERAEKAMVEMENKRVADLEKSAKTLPYPGPLEGGYRNGFPCK
jgi:integrase